MTLLRPFLFLLTLTLSFASSAQVPQGDSCTVSIETIYCCAELFITRDWLLPMLMNGQVIPILSSGQPQGWAGLRSGKCA